MSVEFESVEGDRIAPKYANLPNGEFLLHVIIIVIGTCGRLEIHLLPGWGTRE